MAYTSKRKTKQKQRSGIILYCNHHLLLVQTKDRNNQTFWGFPKGGVVGSDPKESAEREFFEETGVHYRVRGKHHTFVIENITYYMQFVSSMFPVDYSNVPDKKEINDIAWVPISLLMEMDIHMNQSLETFLNRHLVINSCEYFF
jgi:8-oxo-dGTP pyrophosphatase MutT (NUDIX family)